jgi:hypothetical protein
MAGAVLLAAGALSGGILAGTFSADAATGSGSSSVSTSPSTPPPGSPSDHGVGPAGGHSGETLLTGSDAATAKAAALKAVPGGAVDRVESDSGDAAYEAHVTKADGSQVTVKFDKSFKVTAVEDGMGR